MRENTESKRLRIGFFMFLILCVIIAMPRTAYAEETELTEELRAEILDRLDRAYEAGEREVDLADLDIIVNMYTDRIGEKYRKFLDLCREYEKEHGLALGSHTEPFFSVEPSLELTEECNKYGVGPNRLSGLVMYFDSFYVSPDGSVDTGLIARTREKLTREYELAMAVVSDDMTDVEKALALYDYIIAVSNYPDLQGYDENGKETYDPESYSAVSVFRDHISVCVANATAYCYLLSDCGIPCARVDSDEMEHSWVMLKVNGAWYHADPTWDDPRFMDGWTGRGDPNDDIWDLGASGHTYFLKSDEEMINGLQHYGWKLMVDYTEDRSLDGAPESGPSGSFADAFFGGVNWSNDVHFNYLNGEWYFYDWMSNRIVRTAYGADPAAAAFIDAPSENAIKYVYSAGDCLFICERDGIWRYDTVNAKMEKLPLFEDDRFGEGQPVFTEMNVAAGCLNGVVMFTDADEDVLRPFSYPVEEVLNMEAVPETEEETTAEAAATEAGTTPGPEGDETAGEAGTAGPEETASAEPGTEPSPAESAARTEAVSTESGTVDPGQDGSGGSGALPVVLTAAVIAAAAGVLVFTRKKRNG